MYIQNVGAKLEIWIFHSKVPLENRNIYLSIAKLKRLHDKCKTLHTSKHLSAAV